MPEQCIPEQPGPSARPTLPPLEVLESQTQEALAGPSAVDTPPDLSTVAGNIQAVSNNVDVVARISETSRSIASSSHQLSALGVQLLEKEREAHEQ